MQEALIYLPGILLVVVTGLATYYDWRTGHIPNWVVLPALAIGPMIHLLLSKWEGLVGALLGIVVCGAVPYLFFLRDAMGGGDVKLLAAVGALVGYKLGIEIELWSFCVAAAYAMSSLTWQGKLGTTLLNALFLLINPFLPKAKRREIKPELMTSLRFAGSVLVATLLTLTSKWWL